MKKFWLIAGIVIVIAVAGYFGWKWYIGSKEEALVPPVSGNPSEEDSTIGPAEESSEVSKAVEGETMLNINHGNYKGVAFKTYFLTFMGLGGITINEEINEEGYIRFVLDYPSLTAQGNVISRYTK